MNTPSTFLELEVNREAVAIRRQPLFRLMNLLTLGLLKTMLEQGHGDVFRREDPISLPAEMIDRIVLYEGLTLWVHPYVQIYMSSGQRYLVTFPGFFFRRPRFYTELKNSLLLHFANRVVYRPFWRAELSGLLLFGLFLVMSLYFFIRGPFLLFWFFFPGPGLVVVYLLLSLPFRTGFLGVINQLLPRSLPEIRLGNWELALGASLALILLGFVLLNRWQTSGASPLLLVITCYVSLLGVGGLSGLGMCVRARKKYSD